MRFFIYSILFILINGLSYSQTNDNITWWNPANHNFNVIEGQGWPNKVESIFDRLPKDAENNVRKAVWNLSKQSAGLLIRFKSNAEIIKVRYTVKEKLAFPHMPATGVSGVDLYVKNCDGKWLWNTEHYSFGDTIKYHFKNIALEKEFYGKGGEYHLYLPLYNQIEWLEIGTPKDAVFEPLPLRKDKPVVVYGTSIAQGACASRPGMAWTSILERKIDRPIINLGFSGNGMLEEEIINLLTEIDAKLYVLDCLPNLIPNENLTLEEVHQRIISSVEKIRKKRPTTPILLVEHAGTASLNKTTQEAFAQLKDAGISDIYLLSKPEFEFDLNCFVDGSHPSDYGMIKYALAYEKSIRNILHEPVGIFSTTKPVTQFRDKRVYDWEERHNELLKLNKENPPDICFIGNSITHFWGGNPIASIRDGEDSWNSNFEEFGIRNFGYGWDRVENVLWRVYHGELDGYSAKQVVIMLGTNNIKINTNKEIIDGLELLVEAIKHRQPHAKILMVGILPRKLKEEHVHKLNLMISQLAGKQNINYANIGTVLLNDDNKIDETLFSDGLHPNKAGYDKLAMILKKYLIK